MRSMWGGAGHLELRDAIAGSDILAPTLILAGPGFGGQDITAEDAAAEVERQFAEGWDLVKLHWGPSAEVYEAVVETGNRLGMEISGHVPYAVDLDRALGSGQRTIEHLDGYVRALDGLGGPIEDDALRRIAVRTREAGVAMVPTMFAWRIVLRHFELSDLQSMPELVYMPHDVRDRWRDRYPRSFWTEVRSFLKSALGEERVDAIVSNRNRLLAIMDEEGVEILFGSDGMQSFAVPGFVVMREIREMQAAGMSNRRILESATIAMGRYLSDHDMIGQINPGARADLVLLSGDPIGDLATLSRPAGVMVRGHWFDRATLDSRLDEIAARHD